MNGWMFIFCEKRDLFEGESGVGDSPPSSPTSSPPRPPTGAATHCYCEWWQLATHNCPPAELSSKAGRCQLT